MKTKQKIFVSYKMRVKKHLNPYIWIYNIKMFNTCKN